MVWDKGEDLDSGKYEPYLWNCKYIIMPYMHKEE